MADKTDDTKAREKEKVGMVIFPRDRNLTDEEAQAVVDHFKTLDRQHKAKAEAKKKAAEKSQGNDPTQEQGAGGAAG